MPLPVPCLLTLNKKFCEWSTALFPKVFKLYNAKTLIWTSIAIKLRPTAVLQDTLSFAYLDKVLLLDVMGP